MKLIKSFSIYTLSTLLNKGVGFLLIPVFTYYLSQKDYGILSIISTFVSVVTPLILLQGRGAISVEYYKSDSKKQFSDYFISSLKYPIYSFVFFFLFFIIISSQLSTWFEIDNIWIFTIPILAFLNLFPQLSQTIFQVNELPILYGGFSISKTFCELSISILLIVVLSMNFEGRILAILTTGLIFTFISIIILKNKGLFDGKVRSSLSKDALLFGLPLVPHAIGAVLMNASDRFFIAKMVSVEELGVYTVGYSIGSIILIIEHSFTQAWMPIFYKKIKIGTLQEKLNIVKTGYIFALLLIFSLVSLTILTSFIYKYLISAEFERGYIYVFWVALGYVFSGLYKIFAGYLFYLKKTYILGYFAIVNVCLNLALNYFFIKQYGALGAAYATTISFGLLFLMTMIASIKMYDMPWLLRPKN